MNHQLGRDNKFNTDMKLGLPIPASRHFQPDYEFYVDASPKGFGAYLYTHPRNSDETVRWIQEEWPDDQELKLFIKKTHAAFLEFYALLSVVYTWKKKFVNSNVLVWSDSSDAVNMVNHGLTLRESRKSYLKSFKVRLLFNIKLHFVQYSKFI